MKVIVEAIIRAPLIAALVCVALMCVAGAGILRLGFDDGLSHIFASNSPVFEEFLRDREQFSDEAAGIAVHLQAADFAQPDAFNATREFVLQLGLVDGISGTISLFSLRQRPDATGDAGPLIGARLETEAQIRDALQSAVSHPLNQGRLITPDWQNMLVVAQSTSSTLADLGPRIEAIQALGKEMLGKSAVRFTVTGTSVLRVSTVRTLVRDQMVINVLAAVIGFVLCLIAFRGVVPALVAGVPAVVGLVFVLGYLGYSGAGINTATNALPVLILVLGFADSMHLTYETRRRIGLGESYQEAVRHAFGLAAVPCILASVTTAFAFASLGLSGSELVQGLGQAGSVGVMISLVVVLVVNPLLAVWAGRLQLKGWTHAPSTQPLLFPNRFWSRVLEVILHRPRGIVFVLVGVLVVAWGVYAQVTPRYSFLENVPKQSAEWAALQEIEHVFAPVSAYDVIVPVMPSAEGELTEQDLLTIGRVHDRLAARYGADRVISVWSLAQWISPDAPESAGVALHRLLARARQFGGNDFLSVDRQSTKIVVLTQDPGSQAVIAESEAIESLTRDLVPDARVGGLLRMSAKISSEMILDLNRSFLVAVGFSGLVIAIWMRSLVIGIMALVVNILPISLVGAWFSFSGAGLQFTSGLALTIAFGIAVDDTLHALNRLRPKLISGQGVTVPEIFTAFVEVAPVLTATSVILSLGLSATFLSVAPSIAYFGQLSIGVFILALLADLVLLPALLVMRAKPKS